MPFVNYPIFAVCQLVCVFPRVFQVASFACIDVKLRRSLLLPLRPCYSGKAVFTGERNFRCRTESGGAPLPDRPALRKKVSPTQIDYPAEFVAPGVLDAPHQLLAALFDSPIIGFSILDRDLRFKAVNKALAAMHGLPSKAILGKTLREVMGNAAKPLEPVIRRDFATGQFSSAWRISSLLGQKRKIEILDCFPLQNEDGAVERVAFVALRVPEGGNWEQRLGGGLVVHEQPPRKTVTLVTQPELAPRFALCAALFQGLDSEAVDTILKAARVRKSASGEYFCKQGERTDKLYLLKTGLIKVNSTTSTGKEVLLRWVRPGEVFGLGTLAESPLQNAWNAVAAEPSEALEWHKTTIERLCGPYHAFYPNAIWIALRWAHELQTRIEQMATELIEQRLARVITDLSKQVSRTTQAVELQVSDEELAQMVGTTLFTISRVLSRWKRLGYVQKGRKRLLILNHERLLLIAKGLIDSPAPLPRIVATRQSGSGAGGAHLRG